MNNDNLEISERDTFLESSLTSFQLVFYLAFLNCFNLELMNIMPHSNLIFPMTLMALTIASLIITSQNRSLSSVNSFQF